MEDNPWESSKDYLSHNSYRDLDYASLYIIRQCLMNDTNLCYHCLLLHVLSDMIFASIVSRKGNIWSQVYTNNFGWVRAFLMAPRSEEHETCHRCLPRMVSCQLVFVTMPKRWSNISFIKSSKMLHAIWNSWSHMLLGQMLQKEESKSLRKRPVVSFCG